MGRSWMTYFWICLLLLPNGSVAKDNAGSHCFTVVFYRCGFSIMQRVKVICWANTRPLHCLSMLKQAAYILWTIPNNVTCVVPHDWHLFICCWRAFWVSWIESHWDKIWQKLELKYFFYYLEKTLQKVNKLLDDQDHLLLCRMNTCLWNSERNAILFFQKEKCK